MKALVIAQLGLLIFATVGCKSTEALSNDERDVNVWLVDSINDTAIKNAVIAQQSLFPYHFIPNAPALNKLGQRDLEVLAEHHKEYPGDLNVRRGGVSETLYARRVQTVISALVKAGVDKDRISIRDALSGGDGMPSERLLVILKTEKSQSLGYSEGASFSPTLTGGSK